MGPILGTLFGAFVYDAILYTGEENILTRSFVILYPKFYSLLTLLISCDHGSSAQRRLEDDDAV
jgi:hypothetical protein